MTDLRRLLDQAAPPPAQVASVVVDADLARARRGLRRHRSVQRARSGVLVVAACAAAVIVVQPGLLVGRDTVGSPLGPAATRPGPAVELVAYAGPPITGFALDRVPTGWVVEAVDSSALTLVPAGQQDPDGYRELEADGVRALEGRIAVLLSDQMPQRDGTAVEVNGTNGLVVAADDAADDRLGGSSLFLPQQPENYLIVQVPAELNWSVQDLVQFAEGIRVTDDALTTGG